MSAPPPNVTWHEQEGDGLLGKRIVADARKVVGPHVINRSGRHKASMLIMKNDARAWIEQPRSHVSDDD